MGLDDDDESPFLLKPLAIDEIYKTRFNSAQLNLENSNPKLKPI
jgi:hypothetical protein